MGIGRRLRGWGEVGLEGSDCFWQLGKVVTVGGCDAFCPAIAQRWRQTTDAIKPTSTEFSENLALSFVWAVSKSNWQKISVLLWPHPSSVCCYDSQLMGKYFVKDLSEDIPPIYWKFCWFGDIPPLWIVRLFVSHQLQCSGPDEHC